MAKCRKKQHTKTKVLIYCGNGYSFDEIFNPLVESNYMKWDIDLILADYYLSKSANKKIKKLLDTSIINKYSVIPELSNSIGLFFSLKEYLRPFSGPYSIFITGSDSSILDRIIIDHVRQKNLCKVVIIQTGTIWRVLECYLNLSQTVTNKGKHKNSNTAFKYNYIFFILSKIWRNKLYVSRAILGLFEKYYNHLLLRYIFPLFTYKKTYRLGVYDKYSFSSGRADIVILFDNMSAKALKKCVPIVNNVFVARHPLSYFPKVLNDMKNRRLLVCFAQNLNDELSDENFKSWISIITQVVKLSDMSEIHIRCHPRTSVNLKWPKNIILELKKKGNFVLSIDPLSTNLVNSIPEYSGVIGAPSGSLIVARSIASDDVFVSCLPNCSSGTPDDQFWSMGEAHGINCMDRNKKITADDVSCLKMDYRLLPAIDDIITKGL